MRTLLTAVDKIVKTMNIPDKFPNYSFRVHTMLNQLYGSMESPQMLVHHWSLILTVCMVIPAVGVTVSSLTAEIAFTLSGVLIAAVYPYWSYTRLVSKVNIRKRQIIYSLPLFVNQITIFTNAGETLHAAIVRSIGNRSGIHGHLSAELILLKKQLDMQMPLTSCMDLFSQRCAVPEVSAFTSVILSHYRKGGDLLVQSLMQLNKEMWNKRKTLVKTIGEEAAVKLVFPMMLIFIAVIMVVGAPAIMMLNE